MINSYKSHLLNGFMFQNKEIKNGISLKAKSYPFGVAFLSNRQNFNFYLSLSIQFSPRRAVSFWL
ncbi:hypothetical protein SAMN05444412_111108 [Rhodonellum ikkaensis]|uniref:Uncharacterized protein n=1 Tax=Rhodonellum ikkaensis TaxID=336829 RepID=A0A1H3SFC9_9BACT|nr:hypothetical protein SAMN05444412_111108 [Rhodonellum ikkaensis]